ncbi:YtpR family tRNA-binding protein [Bombilactobacillus thymidiniphilus]|uniref:YtpR family tRNA-binding protein n=1 Tax=Bombilactobacillus thymidiniphilus TaxID=2923363 RepID=UPI0037BFB67F
MQVTSYNPQELGDVLIMVLGADTPKQSVIQKGNVVQIKDEQQKVIGYNFFDVAQQLNLQSTDNGQVFLDEAQIATLNNILQNNDFEPDLQVESTPKLVVGDVKEIKSHPDSDHLHVCQIELDNGQMAQIVCGAPNIAVGQKVVVAKVGAMMPSGQIIFAGVLRGVDSAGMVCSARELGLENAPQKRGILVLDNNYSTGSAIDLVKLNQAYQ